jgi:branched-chain amino acid aminotransferase
MTDYGNREGVIWFDGALVAWSDARIPFLTHALHYGSTVFEGIRAYDTRIFKLEEHIDRLFEGAAILGYRIPFTKDEISKACEAMVELSGARNVYIRPAAWRGAEAVGISTRGLSVHVAIAAWEWPDYFSPEQQMHGIRLDIARWRRPAPDTAPTGAKASGLYQICTMAKQEAQESGYDDAMMLDYRGYIAEATGANIFLVIDGALHTPTTDCFLNGITRQTVIALARDAGIEVVERHIAPAELSDASEVFLTGTAAEVTPVASIAETSFTPGAVTRSMIERYRALTRGAATPERPVERMGV